MADDSIRLALPADPAYGRVARTAVAGLALRLGFSYLAIEDLRLAVDEAMILLLRPGVPQGRVTLRFELSDTGLVIDAGRTPDDDQATGDDDAPGDGRTPDGDHTTTDDRSTEDGVGDGPGASDEPGRFRSGFAGGSSQHGAFDSDPLLAGEPATGDAAARQRFEDLVTPIVDAWSIDEQARNVHLVLHKR